MYYILAAPTVQFFQSPRRANPRPEVVPTFLPKILLWFSPRSPVATVFRLKVAFSAPLP